ncbi:hypothetical protein [Sphingobacterium yanglingense]|uniref:Uncharacterized protein n=1 Tax=Sphingobacterium yanglingense TaxID=1437280 RepID=A0A4R6WI99_9SPHI|nr:hypothetical protein [Sphingobacterium yanglingense]TDQ75188.1 hypothetical protein CLV99_3788 [Sphingobacterium yanglingense]
MNSLFSKKGRLSFYVIILLAIYSCKKDGSVDEENESLQAVTFNISGFSNAATPFKTASKASSKASSNVSTAQNYVEGKLYFWSFNSKTLEPDIAYQVGVKPSISFTKGEMLNQVPNDFPNSTYAFEDYASGSAVSIVGAKEIFLKFHIDGVSQITQFGFDTGSSNTGPKDFELYYSLDEGVTYVELSKNNQFGANGGTNNPKNSYIYHLSDKNIRGVQLWFKLIPKAGTRAEESVFNPTSGAIRFDNIRLLGMAPSSQVGSPINKLHYFLFHKDKPELVVTGVVGYDEASSLTLSLAKGKYSICFVANESTKDLLIPEKPTLSSFYVGNTFANASASIFGYVGELEVIDGTTESQISLKRLFSQVKLEFTDAVDLSVISKIGISQQHDPFFYAPFNPQLANPILDQTDIDITADFNANKQLIFNQFMGVNPIDIPLKYTIVVYSSTGVLRTFQLESTLKNNMQLVFRGNLLDQSSSTGKFQISKQMDWGGQKEGEF